MNDELAVVDLSGCCPEWMAWLIVRDVASFLIGNGCLQVSPYSVVRKNDGSFAVSTEQDAKSGHLYLPPEAEVSEAGCVWSLAATVFRLVMGCDVMSGAGGAAQKQDSPLPYMRASMPDLSELVRRSLSFNPSERPALSEIIEIATKKCDAIAEDSAVIPKCSAVHSQTGAAKTSMSDSSWPERMEAIILALCFFIYPCLSFSQEKPDDELVFLMETVSMLRTAEPGEKMDIYDKVSDKLKKDDKWTRMDELVDEGTGECRLTDRTVNWFRLNNILNTIEITRVGNDDIKGDFLNGENPNFRYSLLEKSVKNGSSVKYRIRGRSGKQVFVLMPFNPSDSGNISMSLYKGDSQISAGEMDSKGNLFMEYTGSLTPDEELVLVISNHGVKNIAMVLFNHNTGI